MNYENLYQEKLKKQPLSRKVSLKIALHLMPLKQRMAWIAVWTLQQELNQTFNLKLENEVRLKKLFWWIEELQGLLEGRATHPLTRSMMSIVLPLFNHETPREIFEPLVHAWSGMAGTESFIWLNQAELSRFSYAFEGVFEALQAKICLGHNIQHQLNEYVVHASDARVRINLLCHFGELIRHGNLPIPLSQLNTHGLISQEVLHWRKEIDAVNWIDLASELAEFAKNEAKMALQWIQPLPEFERKSQWLSLALLKADLALLELIEESSFHVISQKIDLSPRKAALITLKTKFFN